MTNQKVITNNQTAPELANTLVYAAVRSLFEAQAKNTAHVFEATKLDSEVAKYNNTAIDQDEAMGLSTKGAICFGIQLLQKYISLIDCMEAAHAEAISTNLVISPKVTQEMVVDSYAWTYNSILRVYKVMYSKLGNSKTLKFLRGQVVEGVHRDTFDPFEYAEGMTTIEFADRLEVYAKKDEKVIVGALPTVNAVDFNPNRNGFDRYQVLDVHWNTLKMDGRTAAQREMHIDDLLRYTPKASHVLLMKKGKVNSESVLGADMYTAQVTPVQLNLLSNAYLLCSMNEKLDGISERSSKRFAVFLTHPDRKVNKVVRLDDPLLVGRTPDEHSSREAAIGVAVRNYLVDELGMGECSSENDNMKHGYVQRVEEFFPDVENAFIRNINGVLHSMEEGKKLIARVEKLARKKASDIEFNDVPTFTVAPCLVEDLVSRGITHNVDAQLDLIGKLNRVFGGGQSYVSYELFDYTGVGRFVTGANVGESCMKTVGVSRRENYCEELHALFDLAKSHPHVNQRGNRFIIQGVNSAKSVEFKRGKIKTWGAPVGIKVAGKTVYVWVKAAIEQVRMTTSYVSREYEVVTQWKLDRLGKMLDSVKRAVGERNSQSVTQLLFTDRVKSYKVPLLKRINYLLAQGIIRKKKTQIATNRQFNDMFKSEFGDKAFRELISALIGNGISREYQENMLNQLALSFGLTSSHATEVQYANLVDYLVHSLAGNGIPTNTWSGFSIEVNVAATLRDFLEPGWIRVVHGDKVANVWLTEDAFEAFEETDREGYIRYQGSLQGLLQALAVCVKGYESIVNIETAEVTVSPTQNTFCESNIEAAYTQFRRLEESQYGKALNRIPMQGYYAGLVSSIHLASNEIYGPGLKDFKSATQKTFGGRTVAYVTFKCPLVVAGSITAVEIIESAKQLFKNRGLSMDPECPFTNAEMDILNGRVLFLVIEKTVSKGNDIDGDEQAIAAVPQSVLQKAELIKAQYITIKTKDGKTIRRKQGIVAKDALANMDPAITGFSMHWEKHFDGELDSTLDFSRQSSYKAIDFAQLAKDMRESVREKALVGRNTMLHSLILKFKNPLVAKLKGFFKASKYNVIKDGFTSQNEAEEFIPAFVFWLAEALGCLVNIDAMDRIKHSSRASGGKVDDHRITDFLSGEKSYATRNGKVNIKFASLTWKLHQNPGDNQVNAIRALDAAHLMVLERLINLPSYNFSCKGFMCRFVDEAYYDHYESEIETALAHLIVYAVAEAHGLQLTTYDPLSVVFNSSTYSESLEEEIAFLEGTKKRKALMYGDSQAAIALMALQKIAYRHDADVFDSITKNVQQYLGE